MTDEIHINKEDLLFTRALEKQVERLQFQMEAVVTENKRLEQQIEDLENCLREKTEVIRKDISLLMTKEEFAEKEKLLLKQEVFTALFNPIQKAYYGGLALLATVVVLAVINLVIKK